MEDNDGGGQVQAMPGRQDGSHIFHNGDGFYYLVRETRGNRCRLMCRRVRSGCSGTAAVNMTTGILTPLQPHTCQRDHLLPEELAFRRDLIERASQNVHGAGVRQILKNAKSRCNNAELARRFTNKRMDSAMGNARKINMTPVPNTLMHLGVLLGLPNMRPVCSTVDGQDHIFQGITGRVQDNSVSLVFASERMITFLQSCHYLHLNFTVVGKPHKPKCSQILHVLTKYGSAVIPIMRVLMRERTEAAYMALFNHIKAIAPNLRPTRFHCDFEGVQINAIKQAFPGCGAEAALWHYAVRCSSQAFELGLSPLAARNDLVLSFIKCLCAAPLLPAALIELGVEEIWREIEASGWANDLEPLYGYIRREWLPHVAELSVYADAHRTSYCYYSDNHMLASVLPQNRQNTWCLLRGFVQTEQLAWSDKLAVVRGDIVCDSRRWKEIAKEKRVCRLIRRLEKDEITPGHFLRETSHFLLAAVHHGLRINIGEFESESSNDSD